MLTAVARTAAAMVAAARAAVERAAAARAAIVAAAVARAAASRGRGGYGEGGSCGLRSEQLQQPARAAAGAKGATAAIELDLCGGMEVRWRGGDMSCAGPWKCAGAQGAWALSWAALQGGAPRRGCHEEVPACGKGRFILPCAGRAARAHGRTCALPATADRRLTPHRTARLRAQDCAASALALLPPEMQTIL